MTADELKGRTKKFSLRVIRLVNALPDSTAGRVIGGQLIRSGTSVGSNYRAACRARSPAEFVSKLGIAEEEADESAYWMELITEGKLLAPRLVSALHQESEELTKIFAKQIVTARGKRSKT